MGLPDTVRIAHVVKFVLESIMLPFEIRALRPRVLMAMLRGLSHGIFHLYISLSPYYTEHALKASRI